MRPSPLLWSSLALTALVSSLVSASPLPEDVPEIEITSTFPENNPFGHVMNGERNQISLLVENKSGLNVTLVNVAGSFHDTETDAIIKNTSTLSYGVFLMEGTKLQIPYSFHSEIKSGDARLHIWVNHAIDDKIFQVTAYDSVVKVVEPEVSFFDYQVITTYLITGAFLAGLGYIAYSTFMPKTKRSSRKTTSTTSATAAPGAKTTTTPGGGTYQDEWIPEHHIKRTKSGGVKVAGAASSGEELSGGETSGQETRRRKSRK
ncbi:hypothetical protein BD410DRAFT_797081 [Rickenella mellea]|uniref:Translocon-associated protein subunit alpha n=1 Tax=Rickenella mellea TaxID=50990 RepID=A0A4Y7PGT9_9AGAM|nr:hypothetical protein BD410DRAFT_797081 [Rickenella mellea]